MLSPHFVALYYERKIFLTLHCPIGLSGGPTISLNPMKSLSNNSSSIFSGVCYSCAHTGQCSVGEAKDSLLN